MEFTSRPHACITYRAHNALRKFRKGQQQIQLNGEALDIATVIAVAKYRCTPHLDLNDDVVRAMNESVDLLRGYLAKGFFVYGVNTGYGGSADSRTDNHAALQLSLMQHTQSAVTTSGDRGDFSSDLQDLGSHAMPYSWVKASMLVRENQTMRGHSAIRVEVVETLNQLISKDLIPLVPLRGSISASGDLMPLSFIAGALQGCPDIFIRVKQEQGYELLPADQALKKANIKPIVLGPKEGLGLINGTAPSAALASLALYETHQLAVLSQYLTILACETLAGNLEWLNPFIADIRPHIGQKEAAANMRTFMAGSKLVSGIHSTGKDRFKVGLCQDRYATRTSQQWIGPQLEDLMLAHQQVTTELNSTTDNPLVDVSASDVHSGGNFQAASITSAMEKARLSLQMLGKMLFGQCTEMINPALNHGLPGNLAADDPSLSFTMKGIDTNMAAYMSELAYIANPVSSHVQSAEQHNQAVNSLAFISARYTMTAVDLVSLMSACFIYVGCQGVDLRVMHNTFLESFKSVIETVTSDVIGRFLPQANLDALCTELFGRIAAVWAETTSLDAHQRCEKAASACISILTHHLSVHQSHRVQDPNGRVEEAATKCPSRILDNKPQITPSIDTIETWRRRILVAMNEHYISHRTQFFEKQTTVEYLGQASQKIYSFVREELRVPFHTGLVEHPTPGDDVLDGRPKKTIGSWVGIIYESLRDGRLYDKLMEALAQGLEGVVENGDGPQHGTGKVPNGC
jgi:phenylalanine ammonia-lyase